jgi:hypothetical protein
MAKNNIEGYLRWITPTPGDPTYSLLKAHLLFEDLLRSYLAVVLPHASSLDGARLTFVQLLAVARASSPHIARDHWIWKAIGDLNKLRNMLSHESRPKAIGEKMNEYVKFIVQNTKARLPKPKFAAGTVSFASGEHLYSGVDMVTLTLYYSAAESLGFNVQAIIEQGEERMNEVRESMEPLSGNGHEG